MTHKKFIPPADKMYVPLHVGKEGKEDLGYLGDNTGDHISHKNSYYSELTGVYWVWKNYCESENVGICHYRRFLVNDAGKLFAETEIESLLTRFDLITTKTLTMRYPYYDGFSKNHNLRDLQVAMEVICEMYPDYAQLLQEMVHKRETWFGNIMICKKAVFDEYCNWLFPIFFEMEKRIDVEDYDDYDDLKLDVTDIEDVTGTSEPSLPSPKAIPVIEENNSDFFVDTKPRKKRGWIGILVLLLILGLLAGGAFYYYNNIYLLSVDNMVIEGFEDQITIQLTTDADESLLRVVCTDTYGNKQEKTVMDGGAVFTGLNPDTMYKITVTADGFHKLTGSVSGSYTTVQETRIVEFTAKHGLEDGSVVLNFTVDGPETESWILEYSAEGEPPRAHSFTGHMVTINDLTVGKLYKLTLLPDSSSELFLNGKTSIEHLASKVIVAEKLSIVSCVDGVLTATWETPDDATVESWTVRCYSEDGYDETVTVTEPNVQFQNIDTLLPIQLR